MHGHNLCLNQHVYTGRNGEATKNRYYSETLTDTPEKLMLMIILKVPTVLPFTLKQPQNSGHPATRYNGQFSRSQLYACNTQRHQLADTRRSFQQDCPPSPLKLTT